MSQAFICGCCGCMFMSTIEKQRAFDQDKDYGICASCDNEQQIRNEAEWLKMEELVRSNLKKDNQETFDSYDLELRRGLILTMIEDGVITYGRPVSPKHRLTDPPDGTKS